jgi:LmbE family N-acetylglucosaminyl deacetylase
MNIESKKILAIGAHPDDIEYGCFGFLMSKCTSSEIHLYVASLGSTGDPTSGLERMGESAEALGALNPRSLLFRKQKGIGPEDFGPVLDELTQLISTISPDLILALGPHDTHQEHVRLSELVSASARRSKASILNYAIVSNTLDFKPNFFVDISQVYENKKRALKAHQSQKDKLYMSEDYINVFHSNTYAALHGIRYSEAFETVRIFLP